MHGSIFRSYLFFPPILNLNIFLKREVKTSCPFPMDQKGNFKILSSFSYWDFFLRACEFLNSLCSPTKNTMKEKKNPPASAP